MITFREAIGEKYTQLTTANLGFFSRPFLSSEGPFSGKIVKVYAPLRSLKKCEKLKENHDRYVPLLRQSGLKIPHTELIITLQRSAYRLLIIQEPFLPHELVREKMEKADAAEALILLGLMLDDCFRFLYAKQQHAWQDMGFHPTWRNYALRENTLYYFDTFPPMACSEREVKGMILDFAPYKAARMFRPLWLPWMGKVTNEYYDPVKMIYGIIGSACRLRPELAEDILTTAREKISGSLLTEDVKTASLLKIQEPPSLSPLWRTVRSMLGKEGKPNVK